MYLGQLQSPTNRESTAIPTVSIAGGFCRMRHYFAQRIVKTLLQLHITVFRDMAWARDYTGGFNNRGFHRHFLKIELIWVVRLWTCCSDFLCYWLSLLTTVSRQIRIQYIYNIKLKCNDHAMNNIDFSSDNSRFSYNNCLSQSQTYRRSIHGFTITDAEIHMPFHNS